MRPDRTGGATFGVVNGWRRGLMIGGFATLLLLSGCSADETDGAGSKAPGAETAVASTTSESTPGTRTTSSRLSTSSRPSTSSTSSHLSADSTTPPTTESTNPAGSVPSTSSASEPVPSLGLAPVGLVAVNDPSCVTSKPPVILLHGTLSSIQVDYPVLAPALVAAGFCVYGADYGFYGTAPVRDSATEFAAVVGKVRSYTGSSVVDVVGFSQGGLVLRTALRFNGLASVVKTAGLISPSFHGTTSALITSLPNGVCQGCKDQAAGSQLLVDLAAGGDLDGGVRYAAAITSSDVVVTPWEAQLPAGPDDRVRSVVLDQQCPGVSIRHQDMSRNQAVVGWIVAALAAEGDIEASDLTCGAP